MSAIDGAFTANDLVTAALKKAGIMGLGQSPYPSGSDTLDALNDLSWMLAEWNDETYLSWAKLDLSFVSDGRAGPGLGGAYTVGPGGNFSTSSGPGGTSASRPDRIEAAYLRILGNTSGMPVDQPLVQMPAREDYSKIALKQLVAFPKAYFYDTAATIGGPSTASLGNLFIYPWPQANLYETHIIVKTAFPTTFTYNTDFSGIPQIYRNAMIFNLALRLRQAYGKGLRPDAALEKLARASLWKIRQSNAQIPQMTMPEIVLGRGSLYNIFGDISY